MTTPADPPRDPAEHHTGDVLGQLQGGRGVFDPAGLLNPGKVFRR